MPKASLFPEAHDEFASAADLLRAQSEVAVVAHVRPDADAVGSACALAAGLNQIGVQAKAYIGQPLPHSANLRTVPGVEDIAYGDPVPAGVFVVTVDCASIDRTGGHQELIEADPSRVLVIDHHATNPGFGGHNLIVESESTTAMVRELFFHLGVELDYELAYQLYAGLVTDTGSFRWGTPRMHVLAAELMAHGLNTRQIALDLMDTMSAVDLQLMGAVLAETQVLPVKGLTLAIITIATPVLARMSQTTVEAIIDYARSLEGTDVGVVFKEQAPGYWAASLRSTAIDASAVAKTLGGGGHHAAAGYSAAGRREDIVRALVDALPDTTAPANA